MDQKSFRKRIVGFRWDILRVRMDTNVVGMVQRCVAPPESGSLTHIVDMRIESARAHESFRIRIVGSN